jgi:hypothetical protein
MVRTKSAAVFDPLEVKCAVVTGYCGVDSAELGRVWSGDLGRCETAASIAVAPPRQAQVRTCPTISYWGCIGR